MLTIYYRKVSIRSKESGSGGSDDSFDAVFSPPVDISHCDNAFTIKIDIPGANADDITIEAWENDLVVSGSIPAPQRPGPCRLMERRSGQFRRALTFPVKIMSEGIEANLNDGVLIIRVPMLDLKQNPKEV
jgi:HSP20 family protein